MRRHLILQIFQVWLDDRKKDWSTKQRRRVEIKPPKLTYNVKDRLLNNDVSISTAKKTRSNVFHDRKRKGDLNKGLPMIDFTVDAINEIETFCYSIILVEHWQHSFHITSSAIIALESFAFESIQAIFIAAKKIKCLLIFDCIAAKKIKGFLRMKANVKRRLPDESMAKVTNKRKRQCR